MKTVYLVEVGCYSSSRVIVSFTDKARADAMVADIKELYSGYARVLEVPHDREPTTIAGLHCWTVWMTRAGSSSTNEWPDEDAKDHAVFGPHAYVDQGGDLDVTVWCASEEAAVKIANEIRVKMIADGSWQPKA